ncbi:MAG TPA: redoxin family protein [Chthonomonadaceae bacterium]|nr:redoxin family protein [Chthonomonadaceae bacterium]
MFRLCGILIAVTVLLASGAVRAARIVVSSLEGRPVAPLEGKARKTTVLVFITNDCPIANQCAPEIERIYRTYRPKGVAMYLVYVDGSLTAAAARAHHKAYGYTCPAVLDPGHRLVKEGSATVTPEAALFDARGRLVYHGRIDDRAVALGRVRAVPLHRDLREALDALLARRPIKAAYRPAVGCSILAGR